MNDIPEFEPTPPKLPAGLDAKALLLEAAAAFEIGEFRDDIVGRFRQRGIDLDIACALVDVMIPGQSPMSGPMVVGTSWQVNGKEIAFDKSPGFARHERREARRCRQLRIVQELLGIDPDAPKPLNPEFDFADADDFPPLGQIKRRSWLHPLVIIVGAAILLTVGIAAVVALR